MLTIDEHQLIELTRLKEEVQRLIGVIEALLGQKTTKVQTQQPVMRLMNERLDDLCCLRD